MRINIFYIAVFVFLFFAVGGIYMAFSGNFSGSADLSEEIPVSALPIAPALSENVSGGNLQNSSGGNTKINSSSPVSSRTNDDDDEGDEDEDEDDSPRRPSLPASSPSNPSISCGSGGACSPAEVASHNNAGNCWIYLSSPINKVYNVTAYVGNPKLHPGGNVIIPYCGKDMYNSFIGGAGDHKHSAKALNTILEAYYIGLLKI